MADLLLVGRVAKAHGIAGELAVDIHTDSPDERFAPGAVLSARLRDRSVRPVTVATVRAHSGRLLVRFDEVPDRTAAETMRGAQLLVDAADLPPSEDPDAFYDHELEGLAAVLADGTEVGTVREIARSPGAELLVISRPDGTESLVPFVREIVPEVDVRGGRVVLDPPEGLLS
ncbi:ribosome maturation factor RimM [Actinophytocola xinjiangensis]|uniref:Ribosome maturation factor RimM n=1 Tax=Actinophytocola xinjiangensis TaxID=485602 RepID=A0A7Z0WJ16_9PSEU|nr:ribosome maturation factor RimM [Actinophytocola xinjiangensis]OLF08444.1 ribosome maturation factor RimM [Actinophytocola xinjiangensis]